MSKGKLAAQVAHASLSSYIATKNIRPDWASNWIRDGQKKVVLKTRTLDDLLEVKKSAERESIPNSIISDAGLTQLEPGTITCIGIGPAPAGLIDKIVGHLKLL